MKRWSKDERYQTQTELIRNALSSDNHPFSTLLDGMRESEESAVYLCGSRIDNEFCFGSEDIGFLVSALPEDAPKASVPGYHPGSTEVYVTFQGRLMIEYLEDREVQTRDVSQHEVAVLPPGRCHRVLPVRDEPAASLIVKTNLSHEPGVVRCSDCAYFEDVVDCPLHRRWASEHS